MSIEQRNQINALQRELTLLAEKVARLEAYVAVHQREEAEVTERRGPGRPRKDATTLHLPGSA